MKHTKLKLTIMGLIILIGLAAAFIIEEQFESGLWMLWFGSFTMVLGIYSGANVVQKIKNNDKK